MPSFYIPLSGLNADSTALNTIANNLSNMNTTGYKSQTTSFSDLFHQQIGTSGSGDEIQVGSGVQVAANRTDFSGGSISTTGVATDAAINGNGFFVLDSGGNQLYTRNGAFQTSPEGTLETSGGLAVMGYGATDGVIKTSGGLTDIIIPTGQVMVPAATSSFGMTQNLASTAAVGASTTGQVKVYDSLGNTYEATVTYTKTGNNAWSYRVSLPDSLTADPATPAAANTMLATATAPIPTTVTVPASAVAPALTTVPSAVSAATPSAAMQTSTLSSAGTVAGPTSTSVLMQESDPVSVPGTTTEFYNFASTGKVNPATSLTITGPTISGTPPTDSITVTPTNPNSTVAQYFADITAALGASNLLSGAGGVTVTNPTPDQLCIAGPTGPNFAVSGTVKQDVAQRTTDYNFVTSSGALATVDPASTLAIAEGASGPVSVPAFVSGQSVLSYAAGLQAALTTAGINDVTVSGNGGVLSITGPTNMSITGAIKQNFSGTQTNYNFGTYTDPTTGLTAQSTVDPATTLTITGPTSSGGTATTSLPTFTGTPETVSRYAADLTNALATAGITGVSVTASNGQLSIVGPSTMTIAGNMKQDMAGTTNNYDFTANATIDPTTNLTITGQTASGASATIIAPTVTAGETVAQYAAALSSALTAARITNVAVSSTAGQLSIVGANMSTSGSVNQGLADATINFNFGSNATVNPATNLTIVGPTVSGTPATAISVAPPVTAGETVAEYAIALTNALTAAGIKTGSDGVSVTATGGQLSIVGPAATLRTAGSASQDLSTTTISYDFGAKNGSVATVDPTTNLTITGQTTNGSTATTAAPTITAGETLAQYATALTNALTAAGVTGVEVSSTPGGRLSIVGANISTSGNMVQNPVASANAAGMLTFDASGKLVSPSGDVKGITFAGLTDGAATMSMDFSLFGANGTGNISQTATDSATTATNQNGYTSGQYESFAIGSDGKVSATYSNGKTLDVGQLAIATVTNLQGLRAVGSSNYQATSASGNASVGVAGSGGRGTLEGSSLEASNVNISAEFSNLIIAQRAFEANSKAVTTFDTVTQETINMIH